MSVVTMLLLVNLVASSDTTFSCDDGKYCPQMRSCEEACYHFVVCGESERDGDEDGIPCENVCDAPCGTSPATSSKSNTSESNQ
jgi:hypothetical protein